MSENPLLQERLVSGYVLDVFARPGKTFEYIFDIYTDKSEGWDKSFIAKCGEYLTTAPIAYSHIYGSYCPFSQDKAILNAINETRKRFLIANGNLIFALDCRDLSQDLLNFASPETMYFDVTFYMMGAGCEIEDITHPPSFGRFFFCLFWRDPWKWFLAQSSFNFVAMISRDHPGLLVGVNTPSGVDCFRERFVEVFSKEGP